jgi:hypothetical protein
MIMIKPASEYFQVSGRCTVVTKPEATRPLYRINWTGRFSKTPPHCRGCRGACPSFGGETLAQSVHLSGLVL